MLNWNHFTELDKGERGGVTEHERPALEGGFACKNIDLLLRDSPLISSCLVSPSLTGPYCPLEPLEILVLHSFCKTKYASPELLAQVPLARMTFCYLPLKPWDS